MKKNLLMGIQYGLLAFGGFLMLLPFIWMLITSLQPASVSLTIPKNWIPSTFHWDNYLTILSKAPFGRYCINSFIISLTTVAGQLITGILAAFAFTHLSFYGRQLLFSGLILFMLIPGELLLIPNVVTITQFHWINTYAALIVPWLSNIFVLFTLHQAFKTSSKTLYYAARIDGASDWQYLWHILVPANSFSITTIAILQFINSWNAFMWPLIVTNSDKFRPLPVGLFNFSSEVGTNYPLLMAATVLVIGPLLLFYLLLQKYITGELPVNLKGLSNEK